MDSIQEQLQIFVRRFGLLNASCCDECCGEQVSMAQSHILLEVRRSPDSSMQRIADGLGLDVTTFSRQVKALEGKGLVARRASAEDRRVSILELTPTGGALLERIDRYMAERISTVFAHMSDFEQDTVVRSLGLLNQALTKIGETDTNREGIVVCCK